MGSYREAGSPGELELVTAWGCQEHPLESCESESEETVWPRGCRFQCMYVLVERREEQVNSRGPLQPAPGTFEVTVVPGYLSQHASTTSSRKSRSHALSRFRFHLVNAATVFGGQVRDGLAQIDLQTWKRSPQGYNLASELTTLPLTPDDLPKNQHSHTK